MVSKISIGMVDQLPETLAAVVPEVGDFIMSARASKAKCLPCDGSAYSRATYAALFAEIGTKYGAGDGSTTFNTPDPKGRALIFAGSGSLAESFAASAVTVATDLITVQTNVDRWITGMLVRATTTGTLPTGLALATDYYVIRISATTIKLASSLANAVAGTAIDITAQGTGTHTLTHSLTARAIGDKGGEEVHASTVNEMPSHSHPAYNASNGTGGSQITVPTSGAPYASTNSTAATGGSGAHNNMPPFLTIGNLFIYAGI